MASEQARGVSRELRTLLALLAAAALCGWARKRGERRGATALMALPDGRQRRATDCIKPGATCTVHVPGGVLTLTNIAFPDGESKPGSAHAEGIVHGEHVRGVVTVSEAANQRWRRSVQAGNDPEPDMASREEQRVRRDFGSQVDSQYSKAMRTIVGNLQRQHEKVAVAENQIADAVQQVVTSHAVSNSIANLALKVAQQHALQEDGDTFLEPKAQQLALHKTSSGLLSLVQHASVQPAARSARASPRGRGASSQASSDAEGGSVGFAHRGLWPLQLAEAGPHAIRKPDPSTSDVASASRPWNEAMAQWQQEGKVAAPDARFPALASGASARSGQLSPLALQVYATQPLEPALHTTLSTRFQAAQTLPLAAAGLVATDDRPSHSAWQMHPVATLSSPSPDADHPKP